MLITFCYRNCSIQVVNAFAGNSPATLNFTWFNMLRNGLLDMVWTKEELASSVNGTERTSLVGATT